MHIPKLAAVMAVAVIGATTVGACGDDAAAEVSHDDWWEAACAQFGENDPGFDQFFTDHPEPTLADWAEFLPDVIGALDDLIAATALPHPSSDDAKLETAAVAIAALKADFEAGLAAAEAGDQPAFDAAGEERDAHGAAMEAAMQAVDERECPGSSE